jgi:hypothetical protein
MTLFSLFGISNNQKGEKGENIMKKYFPEITNFPQKDIAAKYDLNGGRFGEMQVGVVKASDKGFRAFVMVNGEEQGAKGFDTLKKAEAMVYQLADGSGASVKQVL